MRCDNGNSRAVCPIRYVCEISFGNRPLARSATRAKFLTEEEGREKKQEEEREARTEDQMFSQTGELTAAKDYDHNTQELNQICR